MCRVAVNARTQHEFYTCESTQRVVESGNSKWLHIRLIVA